MTGVTRIVRGGSGPRRDLRYGRGKVERIADSELGAKHMDLHVNLLRPGVAPGPYHRHSTAENAYYVLSGDVSVVIDEVEHRLGPGDAAFIPPGVAHSVTNVGNGEARLIEIYAPPDPDFVEVPARVRAQGGANNG